MKYLVIDACLNGTGIRNKYDGGYFVLDDLGLSCEIINRLNQWLPKYENEHYNGFADDYVIYELDQEGREIALMIKNELTGIKVEYFSDALMTTKIL